MCFNIYNNGARVDEDQRLVLVCKRKKDGILTTSEDGDVLEGGSSLLAPCMLG